MFGLITMLVSTLGATGMGSMLKIIAGAIDRICDAKEAKEKRKLAAQLKEVEINTELYKALFGGNDQSAGFTRYTRRIIAIMSMVNIMIISILCTIWPDVPFITFTLPEFREGLTLFWGIIKFPATQSMTVIITTGHMALMTLTMLSAMIGFYFTPAGRK